MPRVLVYFYLHKTYIIINFLSVVIKKHFKYKKNICLRILVFIIAKIPIENC